MYNIRIKNMETAAGLNRFLVRRHTIMSCLVFYFILQVRYLFMALDLRTSSGGGVSSGSNVSRFRPRDPCRISFRYNILILLYITRKINGFFLNLFICLHINSRHRRRTGRDDDISYDYYCAVHRDTVYTTISLIVEDIILHFNFLLTRRYVKYVYSVCY